MKNNIENKEEEYDNIEYDFLLINDKYSTKYMRLKGLLKKKENEIKKLKRILNLFINKHKNKLKNLNLI
jgi:hypothetical protein